MYINLIGSVTLVLRESKYNHLIDFNGNKTIYNALTKSSISITDDFDMQQLLKSNDNEIISTLKKIGMVVDELPDELETLHYLFHKNFFDGNRFLNIVLVPGLDCNFKCPYCFEKVKGTESLFKTNLNDYFSTLKLFAEKNFKNYEMIEVSLFGGEPLLFSNQIFDYFEYIEKELPNVSYFSSIVTNGALLDAEIVHKLIDYKCRSIQITIDGWKEVHDKNRIFKNGKESYDLLIKKINEIIPILPKDCQFNLRINLNNVTVNEVKTTLSDINPQIRSRIKLLFRPIYNTDSFKQTNINKFCDLRPFLDIAIDMGFDIVRNTYYYQACESCSGTNFFFIMPDLSLWKCINDINFQNACIGKINKEGFPQFDADKLVSWYSYSNCFFDEKCKECKKLPDCFGGCVLYRAKNGSRSCKC